MNYTPGPWVASNGDVWSRNMEFSIAVSMGVPMGDSLDNAKIMAAAPEMYEIIDTLENDNGLIPEWLWQKILDVRERMEGKQCHDW